MDIHIDFETRSRVDLKKAGGYKYAENCEIMCMAYSAPSTKGEVKVLDFIYEPDHMRLINAFDNILMDLQNPSTYIRAFNANFERNIWKYQLCKIYGIPDIPIHKWRCTAVQAAIAGFPRSLDEACKEAGQNFEKDAAGKRIMMQLSKPNSKTDEFPFSADKFLKLMSYCRTDVEVEKKLSKILPPISEREQKLWEYDQMINDRGVLIDLPLVKDSAALVDKVNDELREKVREITQGEITSLSEVGKIAKFLSLDNVTKETVANRLKDPNLDKDEKLILEARQAAGLSSVKKYETMVAATMGDNRIRGILQFYGANTGRWSGRIIQPQNLPRGIAGTLPFRKLQQKKYWGILESQGVDTLQVLSSNIRSMIMPEEGKKFIISDFNAIEARVAMWLSGCKKGVDLFKIDDPNTDIYVETAQMIYGKKLTKKNKEERSIGKVAILGCQYGMGSNTLLTYAEGMGINIDEGMCQKIVRTFRGAYPEIPAMWARLSQEFSLMCRGHKDTIVNPLYRWDYVKDDLVVTVSSGSQQVYREAKSNGRENSFKKVLGKTVLRNSITGGNLFENLCQRIARDLLCETIINLEDAGFPVVLHVHDEVVCEVPKDSNANILQVIMNTEPSWAEGLPIACEFEEAEFYKK